MTTVLPLKAKVRLFLSTNRVLVLIANAWCRIVLGLAEWRHGEFEPSSDLAVYRREHQPDLVLVDWLVAAIKIESVRYRTSMIVYGQCLFFERMNINSLRISLGRVNCGFMAVSTCRRIQH